MAKKIPRIDVVATVIYNGGRVLTLYNDQWGAFTLPMTKLRSWPLGLARSRQRWELGASAAMRNVAQCLGVTSDKPARLLADVSGVRQSDRSGQIADYYVQVYGFPVAKRAAHSGLLVEWLTPKQIVDARRQPVSPTARTLVTELEGVALKRHSQFPPPTPAGKPRTSIASVAIITRGQGGRTKWLCQWNGNWERYFLVGGHQEPKDRDALACLAREVKEELGIVHETDYTVQSCKTLKYVGWSTSSWQQTAYTISAFDVELRPGVMAKLGKKSENRWLSKQEVLWERCAGPRLVSPTTREILQKLNRL